MFNKKQSVTMKQTLTVKARRGRSQIVLGYQGDKMRIAGECTDRAGYYFVRNENPECPPMILAHWTELEAA
ncbi:hypothetical protein D3C87_1127190 [compost metagenome]